MNDFVSILEPDARSALLALARRQRYAPGEELIIEGDEPVLLIVLRSGTGKVVKNHLGGRVPVGRLGPGDILGELSFVDRSPASASVVADTEIEADVLDTAEVRNLLERDPAVELPIYRALSITLAQRLRSANEAAIAVPVLGIA